VVLCGVALWSAVQCVVCGGEVSCAGQETSRVEEEAQRDSTSNGRTQESVRGERIVSTSVPRSVSRRRGWSESVLQCLRESVCHDSEKVYN